MRGPSGAGFAQRAQVCAAHFVAPDIGREHARGRGYLSVSRRFRTPRLRSRQIRLLRTVLPRRSSASRAATLPRLRRAGSAPPACFKGRSVQQCTGARSARFRRLTLAPLLAGASWRTRSTWSSDRVSQPAAASCGLKERHNRVRGCKERYKPTLARVWAAALTGSRVSQRRKLRGRQVALLARSVHLSGRAFAA